MICPPIPCNNKQIVSVLCMTTSSKKFMYKARTSMKSADIPNDARWNTTGNRAKQTSIRNKATSYQFNYNQKIWTGKITQTSIRRRWNLHTYQTASCKMFLKFGRAVNAKAICNSAKDSGLCKSIRLWKTYEFDYKRLQNDAMLKRTCSETPSDNILTTLT